MTNDFLKEFWMKWKDILIILIIVLICLMCGLAFLMYKDFQNSKICVDTVVQTISPIIAPTI
jgi:flagellar basal body-associated protein FliL